MNPYMKEKLTEGLRELPEVFSRMEEGEKKMHIMRMSLVGIIGAPLPPNTTAEIEYVPIDRLFVDHRYQANLSPARVRRIQEAYNPIAAGLLLVGARDNGMFAVIDGQHRLEAMKNLGATHALCVVVFGLSLPQEAFLFKACNTNRKRPKAIDVFRARLVGCDPVALEIKGIVESFGYRIGFTDKKPSRRGLVCVGALDTIYSRRGADGLRKALAVVFEAWPDNTLANQAIVIDGVNRFLTHYEDEISIEQLTGRLSKYDPAILLREARALTEVLGGQGPSNFARSILKYWNHGRRQENRLDNRFGN